MNKFYSKPFYYCPKTQKTFVRKNKPGLIYFASRFEFSVFEFLEQLVGMENIEFQVPIVIKKQTANYPPLVWRCDFRVFQPGDKSRSNYVNIEAKGLVTREFKRNLQYLELEAEKEYRRLIVVGEKDCQPIDKQVKSWSINQTIKYLKQMGYLLPALRS